MLADMDVIRIFIQIAASGGLPYDGRPAGLQDRKPVPSQYDTGSEELRS